jgi:hypothetical protein
MKKIKIQEGLFIYLNAFVITFSSFYFLSCSNNDSISPEEDWPDQIQVGANDYNSFAAQFNDHFASLPLDQKELLGSFFESKSIEEKSNPSAKTNDGTQCNCLPGQTSCSADSWWSSCCICCSGGTSAVCGQSGPITTCRCNEKDISSDRAIDNDQSVTIYPNRFKELFAFANRNSIDFKSLEVLFKGIMKKNL